jgi:SAM-dependent methyltransferase
VDLGCGTGEHVAFFAAEGCRAVGIDRSEAMLEAARSHERAGRGRFVEGDLLEAGRALGAEPPFGLAICLGNVLPHLEGDEDLARFLGEVARLLLPGGLLLLQVLNYERILGQGVRALPVDVRAGETDDEEIVFLRLMKPAPRGRILFFPTTLVLRHGSEEPVEVRTSRRVQLRAWTRSELGPALRAAGFAPTWHGDMAGGPFEGALSPDLVVVARRETRAAQVSPGT